MATFCPTARVEKLLLASDRSAFSEGAIKEAILLAKKCSSFLTVMSVVEANPEFDAMAPQIVEKIDAEVRQHLEAIKERAKKEGVTCETVVRRGDEAFALIAQEAEERKITMIIMGRRGRTGLSRLMMGSVTARVIGQAPCNVLVVPRAAQFSCQRILVATDGSRFGDAAVSEAMGIAKRCGSELLILSVVPSESVAAMDIVHSELRKDLMVEKELKAAEATVQEAKDAAAKEGIAVSGLLLSGKPSEGILLAAKEKKADLIILGTLGKTGMDRLLMGSVTERVIVTAECAVLAVKTTA